MLKNLNYVIFDLETTWLDTKKDEPIQIGIVQFDKIFEIKKTFSSYIKPKKNISQLKDIVSLITWLNLSDLQNAPSIQQILPQIKQFFTPNTIIIGHNIWFDITILQKYLKFPYKLAIDTFPFAKTLLHFFPSYSLEVIDEIISEQFSEPQIDQFITKTKAHDALYDSLINFKLFKFLTLQLQDLLNQYPHLNYFIQHSRHWINEIFDLSPASKPSKLFLPSLQKSLPWEKKYHHPESISLDQFENLEKIYIGNISPKTFAKILLSKDNKFILSFANKGKMQIFKDILEKLGVQNIGILFEDIIFSEEKIQKLLNKNKFEDFEIDFLIKYFSQYSQWHSFLDINKTEFYRVFKYISDHKEKKLPNIVLSTHNQLFKFISEKKEKLTNHTIIFLDADFWYQSFKKFVIKPIDFHSILNEVENLIYAAYLNKDSFYSQLVSFYQRLNIFIWILFMDITKVFRWVQSPKIELWPIINDIDFWKSKKIYLQLQQNIKELIQQYSLTELKNIQNQIDYIFNNLVEVERKIYDQDKIWYIFYPLDKLINYDIFLQQFEGLHTLLFTNINQENSKKLIKENEEFQHTVEKITNFAQINKILEEEKYKKIFILTNSKEKTKEFIKKLMAKDLDKKYSILAENITWWRGKIVFQATKEGKKIIFGGYELFFNILANTDIDKIYAYNLTWPFEKQIIQDVNWWWGMGKSRLVE